MADRTKGLIVGGIVLGLVVLWPRKGRAMLSIKLSPHFELKEFLRSSTVPSISDYNPNHEEIENLTLHANYLESIRDQFGPMLITGGLRPKSFRSPYYIDRKGVRHDTPQGISMTDALRAVGYGASETSDHIPGNGSDFRFLRLHMTHRYVDAFNVIKGMPNTRQVILYLTRGADGNLFADHLHVSNVAIGYPKESEPNYAWIEIDGKRISSDVPNV